MAVNDFTALPFFFEIHDLRAASVTVGAFTRSNSSATTPRIRFGDFNNVVKSLMIASHFFIFGFDLLAFERSQTAQLHVEDRVGLQLCQLVSASSVLPGSFHVRGGADDVNHLIQIL